MGEKGDRTSMTGAPVEHAESEKGRGGPLSILFAPDRMVWDEARRLVGDRNIRVESLAVCASQDPVIVMELLRASNAMYFSGGKAAITSTKTAIVRLGSDVVTDLLKQLGARAVIENEDVRHWFELHRSRCKRTAILARMLAEAVAKKFTDECHSAGLLLYVGEMLAVAHLGEDYVSLAEEMSRSGIKYRLGQDFGFDVEKMGFKYLHRYGIPESLLTAIDREGQPRSQDRAIIKPIVWAAGELVDAFDSDRWEKLAPGKSLSSKSHIRLLQMADSQYLKVYERASEYLFSSRLLEEKRRQEALSGAPLSYQDDVSPYVSSDQQALESEIQNLLSGKAFEAPPDEEEAVEPETAAETKIVTTKEKLPATEDQFSLKAAAKASKTVARTEKVQMVAPPPLRTNAGQGVVNAVSSLFEEAKSSEDLLSSLLAMLVDKGPFEKSALIVVSKDRKHAIVVAARGPIGNGQKLQLDDPLSPLAQCFSKVQSFGNKESATSPFGSKAFAVAPIDADHETPVALYADCGNDSSLAFESRRIFRVVVDILNQKLPSLPGGIPIELEA